MALYRSSSILDDIKREFRQGNMVTRLIMVNVGVFLAINLVRLLIFFGSPSGAISDARFVRLLDFVAMPMDPEHLLMRPWTVITYMFLHVQLLHILFNMLFLFWFGRILFQFVGNRKILPIYVYGGLVGAFLAVLAAQLPQLAPYSAGIMLGASAGVMAILAAAATTAPDYTVFLLFIGPVRLKYIALITIVVLDLLAIPSLDNVGGHIAHIGGALLGFVFIRQSQRGRDWSLGFNRVFEWFTGLFSRRRQPRVVYRSEKRQASPKRRARYEKGKQEQLDEILDKIARSGYDNLTKEEKEFLFRVSKED